MSIGIAFSLLVLHFVVLVLGQTDTLGLRNGLSSFQSPTFSIQLVKDSQTLYSLKPTNSDFDFIPSDVMTSRASNGQYHLGDITFRARKVGTGNSTWIEGDSAASRRPVTPLSIVDGTLAAADLGPTLPSDSPLNITRRWILNDDGGHLELLFDVKNKMDVPVEIGSLGAPLEFNNIFTNRPAAETNERCSLSDPYIGQDAGYVQVTPLLGTLPPLLVLPSSSSPSPSPFEGWRFLREGTTRAPFYQSQTFEGIHEWQFHTLAWAENEWSQVSPWNVPTSVVLGPGEGKTYGFEFRLAPSVRGVEDTLRDAGRPVAVGIPGYILSADQIGKLFLYYSSNSVSSIDVSPEGALSWEPNTDARMESGWVGYTLTPSSSAWGRTRLTIQYEDGSLQTVHYFLTKPSSQVISDLGSFFTTEQWFEDPDGRDPFNRSPSVISYDREAGEMVMDDARAWIPGLSDEAGAGSWLAALMKEFVLPGSVEEVGKLQAFINTTLWGSIQNLNGKVKKSTYFYEPSLVPDYSYPTNINWGNWWSWNRAASYSTDRAYDYVHVVAAYWAMYRVVRNYPSLSNGMQGWEWYLRQAAMTVDAMTNGGVSYVDVGLMGETVFLYLLEDLKREGFETEVGRVESSMRRRWERWSRTRYPFGSEMAWDSTGQEGVYAWSKYFNDTTTSANALNSILAYQPLIPHWGYNGNARRYWDNIYGGKLQRIERQIHHYGSGLNALPLISEYQSSPTDYYLLRVGFAGLSGPLSNIDQQGFASASFHAWADTLHWDAYSGDYGPGFSGHAMGMGTFIIKHPDFGWQAFGGNVNVLSEDEVEVDIRDSVKRRVFIAPLGALLELTAGVFEKVRYVAGEGRVVATILSAPLGVRAASALNARLFVKQTAEVGGMGVLEPMGNLRPDTGAWVIEYEYGVATVTLTG